MISKILGTFFTRFSSAILNFLIVILLSQNLGAAGKGEASLFLATVSFILIFCDVVGGSSLVYLIPRKNLFQILCISYTWSFIVCISTALLSGLWGYMNELHLVHIIAITFLQSLININMWAIIADERMKSYNLINILQTILNAAFLLIGFYILNQKTVFTYINSLYIAYTLAFIGTLTAFPWNNIRITFEGIWDVIKDAFRYGFYNQLAFFAKFISFRLSYFLLAFYHGEKFVGIYSNSVSIAESIWLICRSISLVQFSKITNSSDKNFNMNLTIELSKVGLFLTFISLGVLLLLPSTFYEHIFGNEFRQMPIIISYLAPGILFYTFISMIEHYFAGIGLYKYNTLVSTIALLLTCIGGISLIPNWGMEGAAITASIAYTISSFAAIALFLKDSDKKLIDFLPDKADLNLAYSEIKNMMDFKTSKKI